MYREEDVLAWMQAAYDDTGRRAPTPAA